MEGFGFPQAPPIPMSALGDTQPHEAHLPYALHGSRYAGPWFRSLQDEVSKEVMTSLLKGKTVSQSLLSGWDTAKRESGPLWEGVQKLFSSSPSSDPSPTPTKD